MPPTSTVGSRRPCVSSQPVSDAVVEQAVDFASFQNMRRIEISGGHPGLTAIGFPSPDDDGLWRFPDHSYGRPLARPHPATVGAGHPA